MSTNVNINPSISQYAPQQKSMLYNKESMHTKTEKVCTQNNRTIAFKISERSEIKVNDLAEEMAENSGF